MRTLSPPMASSWAMASLATSSSTGFRLGLLGAGRRGIPGCSFSLAWPPVGEARRLFLRLHDQAPARTLKPDIAVISPAIQITAALVLSDKGHQGGEGAWHGTGR